MLMRVSNLKRTVAFLFLLFVAHFAAANSINPNAFYVDKDHPSASDSNPGTATAPWLTIQHALNQITPGIHIYVKESIEPYYGPYRASGANVGGFTITSGGTANAWVYIEGYPGERPTINQQRGKSSLRAETGTADSSPKDLGGFYIHQGDYIKISNFEITQTSYSGLSSNPGAHNSYIVYENNHIHHAYGSDNVGGVLLSHTDECSVKNNIIHDIYDTKLNSNPLTSELYGLHAGVHGYEPGNCIIENNLIYHVAKGVYQKTADRDRKNSNIVRRNIFRDLSEYAYFVGVQGAGAEPALNPKFYENVVYNVGTGVYVKTYETKEQSDGMEIYNNTFVDVDYTYVLKGMTNISIYNNIEYKVGNLNLIISDPSGYGNINSIKFYDHNLVYETPLKWYLNRYAADQEVYTGLLNWQSSFTTTNLNLLLTNPDSKSKLVNPLFKNGADKDYNLELNSPARGAGRNGEDLGAFGLGGKIGPPDLFNPPKDFNVI